MTKPVNLQEGPSPLVCTPAVAASAEPSVRGSRRSSDGDALLEYAEAALRSLHAWMKARDYAGHDPYDLLNSPLLSGQWARRLLVGVAFLQFGKRFGGSRLRELLRVPASKNPKALGLVLAALCDLAQCGEDTESEAVCLRSELDHLRSPGERCYCWGYDWDFLSLRGASYPAFSPNAVATCFCGSALLAMSTVFGDAQARGMAESAGEFVVTRLQRSLDTPRHLCFSYTPGDRMKVYNSSAMAAALLARLAAVALNPAYLWDARKALQYLADEQRSDGSWTYGPYRKQHWNDSFHTGYNLLALLDYQKATSDNRFADTISRGYRFYAARFFRKDGAPKYFPNRTYPIDIHCCAQAILTFCAFADQDQQARKRALEVLEWTLTHMRRPDGAFDYQHHLLWTDRTPYIRWGQAWMFLALARLWKTFPSARKDQLLSRSLRG